jgi:regulator of protease activity HflC (stomatin/prohibitin superfamily)
MLRSVFWKRFIQIFAIIIACGGLLLMIVLLALCINRPVGQDEYAIGYDTYNMKFTRIYTQGKYVTDVGEELILMKRTLQEYNKQLICLTKDKMLLTLDATLQFQYKQDALIPIILLQFGNTGKYNAFIENRVTSSILATCLKYNAEDYYTYRSIIDIDMYNQLVINVNDDNIGTNIEFFQLVNIEFPKIFSNAISQKQTIQQEALTATNNRQSILTNAETILYETQRSAEVVIINANNTAKVIINKAYADSGIQLELWDQRANGYEYTANSLNLNGSDIISYIESDNVKKSVTLITNS